MLEEGVVPASVKETERLGLLEWDIDHFENEAWKSPMLGLWEKSLKCGSMWRTRTQF